MQPKISVIIPCFNEEKNIGMCLDSIFAVDYPKHLFEVIVVDNGSTDRTCDIAQKYNIVLLRDDKRKVSGLRNLGAESATGEVLAFVDADCIVFHNWLSAAREYFYKNDVISWGSPPVVTENATWVQKTWYLIRQKKNAKEEVEWLESMNLFVRRKDFFKVKGFNEKLETAEDVDFCYRIGQTGKIISDIDIKVIHNGEAKDLKTFVKKEIWRGTNNLSGIRSHGLSTKEIPSLIVPLYYGLMLPVLLLLGILLKLPAFFFIILGLYIAPVFVVILKTAWKLNSFKKELFFLFFLLQVYFLSRSIALFKLR